MSLNLEKGSRIDLTKTNSNLTEIYLGLGWDPVKAKFGGLFGGASAGSIDLDGSAILLDANKNVVDTVYFGKLSSQGIKHSGDNRTGDGDGDDESIVVSLNQLPSSVTNIVFTINSFTGQNFNSVANAHCRILNNTTKEVLGTFDLSAQGSHTALIVGSLYKHNADWKFRAIGETANGRTARDLQTLAVQLG